MKKLITCTAGALLLFSGLASADTYREVWDCELEDGKTIEDVQAVNTKWLAWVRKNVNKDINSAVLTAVVGDQDGFIFVDTYPSLAVWSAVKEALDTEEGQAIEAGFVDVSECDNNRLLRHRQTP